MDFFYSVSSIIEEDVSVGQGSKVWYFTHICHSAKIGRDTNVGEKCYIGEGSIIGDDVKITNTKSDDNRSYHVSSEKILKILSRVWTIYL